MNGNTSQPYDNRLSLVYAEDMQGHKVLGHLFMYEGKTVLKPLDEPSWKVIHVNPYTICRNSGIKDKNSEFIFEYDLLKLTHGMKSSRYGFLIWDEFYKSWKIRCRTDRTAYQNLDQWTIEVVGNIVLNDADAEIIYQQEKEDDAKETFIDNSYCPSNFRK